MRNDEIIEYDDLLQMSGKGSPADLAAWLTDQGIRYFRGKYNRPSTTKTALNVALGIAHADNEPLKKSTIEVK